MPDVEAIAMWVWRLPDKLADDAAEWSLISEGEAARARRFVFSHHRARYVGAHARMRTLLGACVDAPPLALTFVENAFGKPRLTQSDLHFNLSHSDDYAALAVRWHAPIGVDIERIKPVGPEVARHYFSPAEQADMETLSGADWLSGFYRCWTRKEAVLKADGQGLAMKLDTFDVTLKAQAAPALLRFDEDPASLPHWRILHCDPAPGFIGAIALPHSIKPVRLDLTVL